MIAETIERPDEFHFTNEFGERWVLYVSPSRQCVWLRGDETGWTEHEEIHFDVEENELLGNEQTVDDPFLFNREEREWLRRTWREIFGADLKFPLAVTMFALFTDGEGLEPTDPAPA